MLCPLLECELLFVEIGKLYEAMTITQTVAPVKTTGEECSCVGVLVGVPLLLVVGFFYLEV